MLPGAGPNLDLAPLGRQALQVRLPRLLHAFRNPAVEVVFVAEVGARLRTVREERDLSQDHVARRLGITRANYVNFEVGRTPLKRPRRSN